MSNVRSLITTAITSHGGPFERLVVAALLTCISFAGAAQAEPRVPSLGTFSSQDAVAAIRESEAESLAPPARSECHRTPDDIAAEERASLTRASDDNDATHYCRGLTLIINLFIDHAGGSWSASERNIVAARNDVAKQYFIDGAPPAANVRFDAQGPGAYWYYTASVPEDLAVDDDFTFETIEAALDDAGFNDADGDGVLIDDATYWLKAWNGGWDNVILVAQPADLMGRASASYDYSYVRIFTDDTANVRAHEWGHTFGSCDEYVENGQCGGGMNCGPCQSWYLSSVIPNLNCQLVSCNGNSECLMINNTFNDICSYTRAHWGWTDGDANGILDPVKRRVSGSSFVDIHEIANGQWIYWNSITHGYAVHQKTESWSVVGMRSPATADYNLTVFGDNDHRVALASSNSVAQIIDFVVGDYNHSPLSNEHVQVSRAAGAADEYRIQYESGTSMLYPDGNERTGIWNAPDVVRVWDVPLFEGERLGFALTLDSGTADLGMALFKSNGGPYWAGRSGALWIADDNGPGGWEAENFVVPATDVYGLVIFANTYAAGDFRIQIGPNPEVLAEETPITSVQDLLLLSYTPTSSAWSVIGNRPEPGGNTTVRLFDNFYYQLELETSALFNSPAPANIDFIAVDYNHAPMGADYVRIIDETGASTHRTEWEHNGDILAGATPVANWSSGHVCKVWDAQLQGGVPYMLRSYGTSVDQGLYFFGSTDGDNYKQRANFSAAANNRPASSGEWLSFTPSVTDWYGAVMIVNDESSGLYENWLGRKIDLVDDSATGHADQIQWGTSVVDVNFWHAWGIRAADPIVSVELGLYANEEYVLATRHAIDTGPGVQFIVADFNHTPLGTKYPRVVRASGTSVVRAEMEGGQEGYVYSGGPAISAVHNWPSGDVVEIFDLYLSGSLPVRVQLNDASGVMDLGMALFKSNGAAYYSSPSNALAHVHAAPAGASETFTLTTPVGGDWYGLVVYNKGETGGGYEIIVGAPTATDVSAPESSASLALAASPNPFRDDSSIRYSLPREDRVSLDVYDTTGRLVRRLVNGPMPAGHHEKRWDGRDEGGSRVGAGVYFARLKLAQEERVQKLTRVR